MPIVFDNHSRGNNDNNSNSDNNGHKLLLLQQQQQKQQQDEEGRILKSGSFQYPLKSPVTSTWPFHAPSPEHNNNINDMDDLQQQSRLLSSGNDTSLLPLSSLPEPTEMETRQSATATGAPIKASCLSTKLDVVSWDAASQLDHHRHHHRQQQEQQPQQQLQQGQQRSSSREETAYPPLLSVSTQLQGCLRGCYNGIGIDNKSNNTGAQQQHHEEQHEQMKGSEGEQDNNSSYPIATVAEGRSGLGRGSPLSSSSSSLSFCSSSSSSSSTSPSFPPSSPLHFSFPSMPSLADNNPLLPSPLLLSSPSSLSFAYTCSPLSPPDSATTALPPLSVLSSSPSRSNSLTADGVDLDPACVGRGNVALHTNSSTGKSGSSVAAASSSLFSENSIPCKGEEPSPRQTDPAMHCTSPSQASSSQQQLHQQQQRPAALSSSFPPPAISLGSTPRSLVVAVFPPSSDERRSRREQKTRAKRRSMDDNSSNINRDGFSSPFPSPIEPDHFSLSSSSSSSPTSKGLVVACKSEPITETMSPNPTMDSRMTSTTAGTTTFATVETVSLPVVESSEKRVRKRRVSEGHNTTPAAKATKNAESPASITNNNRLERRKASSASSSATSSTARPDCSYTTMIMEVFQASSKVKLDLPDIYGGIMGKYPFYRKAGKVWQSSVRHALSQSKFFCKLERGPGEPGKGSLWIIDSENKQTPNHSRKRKASGGNLGAGDYVSASRCPTTHSRVTRPPKLACTIGTIGESFEDEKSREFQPSAASIPSPAASDDVDDGGTVRRSGRARRPPRTKEADDYITTASHSRKPSLVAGASLSTPPTSPAPQDHHSETNARMTSPPPPSRKRSSSIRSDRSLTSPVVSRMNHFTIDLPLYSPTMSAPATPTATPGTLPRRAPLDLELAGLPGVVTSPRIRRPPQKLAEFVSSEDFKAAPCGKRPSLVSASSSSSLPSGNQDRTASASSTTTTTTTPGAEAGQRVERRGRKRARPDVGGQSASSSQQQQNGVSDGVVGRSNRRAMTVNGGRTKDAVTPVRQQSASSLLAAAPTSQSPVSATTGCAPAFISLKDLELSHATSLEEDYDDEDDYFGAGRCDNNRGGTRGVSSRRHGGGGRPVCQNETYEQRRLAGIQQIVVASLDWYEESDSEDDEAEDVGVEDDSDTDMGDINGESTAVVGRLGGGGVARSGCDSGFDSESDSCKGFVREAAGWMMTEEVTELVEELVIESAASSQVLERCQSEAFETVCIAPAEVLAVGGALVEALSTSASHFLDHTEAGLVTDQDGDGLQPCSVAVDESSLLPIITGDVPSPLADMIEGGTGAVESGQPATTWGMPMIPGGILKELAAVTVESLELGSDKTVSGVEDIVNPMEVEQEEHGGDATVHIEAATTTTTAVTASETTEMKADNYMGWLNL